MSVVSISLDYVSPAHHAVKKNHCAGVSEYVRDNFFDVLKYDFRAFLIVVHQNKTHFWNPEAKLDKVVMLKNEILCLEI